LATNIYDLNDLVTNYVDANIQNWYLSQCNGEWEHSYGVAIDTLDNPGWVVKIDLNKTPWEKAHFEELKFERAPDDWVRCLKEDAQFKGYGDSQKLELILNHFLSQVSIGLTSKQRM